MYPRCLCPNHDVNILALHTLDRAGIVYVMTLLQYNISSRIIVISTSSLQFNCPLHFPLSSPAFLFHMRYKHALRSWLEHHDGDCFNVKEGERDCDAAKQDPRYL